MHASKTATQRKRNSRKGLLPPIAVPHKQKQNTKASPSQGSKSGAVASVPRSEHGSSTAVKPSKAAKIDKYTGKKKGTLFSAAPTPSKASKASTNPKASVTCIGPRTRSSGQGDSQKAAQPAVRQAAGDVQSNKSEKACLEHPKAVVPPASGKKKRHQRKQQAGATHPSEARGTEASTATATATPSIKGATGKNNWDRLKAHALKQSKALPVKPHNAHAAHARRKRKREAEEDAQKAGKSSEWLVAASQGIVDGKLVAKSDDTSVTEVLALDCEMVGVGTNQGRKRDALARAALVCTSHCT
jgi:hypothetical protein